VLGRAQLALARVAIDDGRPADAMAPAGQALAKFSARLHGEHFKAYYGPAISARANAARSDRADEFDAAIGAFCDEWNCGTAERARFEKEYLLAVGTRLR